MDCLLTTASTSLSDVTSRPFITLDAISEHCQVVLPQYIPMWMSYTMRGLWCEITQCFPLDISALYLEALFNNLGFSTTRHELRAVKLKSLEGYSRYKWVQDTRPHGREIDPGDRHGENWTNERIQLSMVDRLYYLWRTEDTTYYTVPGLRRGPPSEWVPTPISMITNITTKRSQYHCLLASGV